MSRTAMFANAFNDLISTARKEADQQKSAIQKELDKAREQYETAAAKVEDLESQLAEIDEELAVGLVAAARNAGIKIDLKRANQAVAQTAPASASTSTRKTPGDTAREKAAVMALLNKQSGRWMASTEIKDTTGVERPVSVLLKGETSIESRGKGRGVQYRLKS